MCLGNHTDSSRFDKINSDPQKELFNLIDPDQSPMSSDCKYMDPNDVKLEHIDLNDSQLAILHLNIHSVPAKLNDLNDLLLKLKERKVVVDVILLCETFITDLNKDKCNLDGFELFDEHRKNMTKGGVAIYVNKKLSYKERKDLNYFEEGKFESCFIEISTKSKNIVVGEIYRIPGTNELDFISKYESIITKITQEKKDIIIGTDQNLDYLKIHIHTNTAKFLDVNLSNDLLPSITKPTRITHRTCTLIDNIYVSNSINANMESFILTTDISDHLPCLTVLNTCKKVIKDPLVIETRKLDKENIGKIRAALRNVNWYTVANATVNDGYNFIVDNITSIMDTVAPKKLKRINPAKIIREPWMSPGLVKSSKSCDKKFNKLKNVDKEDPRYVQYKKYRNLFNKLKKKAKNKYYADRIESFRHNSRKLWRILKEVSGKANDKTTFSGSSSFHINNTLTDQPDAISNGFCKYYSEVGKKHALKIPPSVKNFKDYMPQPCDSSIFFSPTSYKEIYSIVSKMRPKNSSGYDEISNKLLKGIIREISTPLLTVFNLSLKTGVFPDRMKISEVIPVYKAKDKTLMVNYRPISLLPVISKVLEKIVYKRMYSFLMKKELLFESQYGFRNKHSTIDAILEFIGHIVKGFERNDYTLAIFIDLSKAFDTIRHDTLLAKLNNFGIRGSALKWFESYFSNRKMYVKYQNSKSEIRNIEYGTPQGSVLGPLVFLLLTTDLSSCLKRCKSILYADDTTLYATHKNIKWLKDAIKQDIDILIDWFRANTLSLNLGKTSFMLFKPKKKKNDDINITLSVGGTELKQENVVKFLGMYLDEYLSWDMHVKNVCGKLSKNLYMIRSVKNLLPSWSLKTLYSSYIHSHLIYGLSIWGTMASKSNLKRVRILQNKALRAVAKAKFNANATRLCKNLNLLNVDDLIELELTKISYRYIQKELPSPVANLFLSNAFNHRYQTRFRNNPRIEKHKTAVFNKSFLCKAPSIWASLPPNIKINNKLNTLKRNFKKFKIEGY